MFESKWYRHTCNTSIWHQWPSATAADVAASAAGVSDRKYFSFLQTLIFLLTILQWNFDLLGHQGHIKKGKKV